MTLCVADPERLMRISRLAQSTETGNIESIEAVIAAFDSEDSLGALVNHDVSRERTAKETHQYWLKRGRYGLRKDASC